MTNIRSAITTQSMVSTTLVTRTLIVLATIVLSGPSSVAQSNNLTGFEHLKQPRITSRPNQKMLVVEAKGDPNVSGGQAFGLLFQLHYSLPETPKGLTQPIPRARWPEDLTTPKAEWTGLYALPIPESVAKLPEHQPQAGLKASLATWEYGKVAEILHLGPYNREKPTMQRLKEFIREQGYVTVGGHEEEYISGPAQGGKGDPEKYMTIIRYRVRKADKK
jgi:hypothetical protein